ncbi:Proteasome assembly chaperone 4 [Trichoplax sp. H2]|nr:Proteasome assembly chaperone 4 [Trichoplax sp. H2]|eukprot:RDD47040.1 Proteasome assembly chaperone 4 [Trichoplax sp. H2]
METKDIEKTLDTPIYNFSAVIGDTTVYYHVMKMDQSLFFWIGTSLTMDDMAVAIGNRDSNDGPPVACKIIGDMTDMTQTNLALKLCKRTGKQSFVSYNVPEEVMPDLVQKRLIEEMVDHPEKF